MLYVSIFFVPFMMLNAIKYGLLEVDEDQKPNTLRNTIVMQGLLFIWWIINYSIINALGPDLSGGMIFMQVLYALITLWFFATISLKAIDIKKFLLIVNPLVLLFGSVFVLFAVILLSIKY